MGRVDHRLVQRREACEYLVEHAKPAPADKAVVDCLGRPAFGRRITPPQPVPDYEDNAADDPSPHVTAENTAQSGASAPAITRSDHPWQRLLTPPLNQPVCFDKTSLTRPEPEGIDKWMGPPAD